MCIYSNVHRVCIYQYTHVKNNRINYSIHACPVPFDAKPRHKICSDASSQKDLGSTFCACLALLWWTTGCRLVKS